MNWGNRGVPRLNGRLDYTTPILKSFTRFLDFANQYSTIYDPISRASYTRNGSLVASSSGMNFAGTGSNIIATGTDLNGTTAGLGAICRFFWNGTNTGDKCDLLTRVTVLDLVIQFHTVTGNFDAIRYFSTGTVFSLPIVPTPNTWNTFAFYNTGGTSKNLPVTMCCFNGRVIPTESYASGSPITSSDSFVIGARNSIGYRNFPGLISHLVIINNPVVHPRVEDLIYATKDLDSLMLPYNSSRQGVAPDVVFVRQNRLSISNGLAIC
jgi:hypothetical protein